MQGIIDRIEDGIAVILIEEVGKEWTINETELPEGAVAGTILQLAKNGDEFEIIRINQSATETATKKAHSLQNKLRAKKKASKFKRN